MFFFEQNIKWYYCDYCKKSDYREFHGVLFESDFIVLSVKERGMILVTHNTNFGPISFNEVIYPSVKEIYSCFTREDFKIIKYPGH